MTKENSSQINRRNVLKSAGVVAGFGLANPALATSNHGSVRFSELRIEYDVSVPEGDELTYPIKHLDEFGRAYAVDSEQSVLYINERYAEADLEVARNNDNVLSNSGFSTPPTTFGGCQKENIVTQIEEDFRASQLLSVSGNYKTPRVSAIQRQDGIVVEAGSKRTKVQPADAKSIILSEEEVTVEAYRTVEKDPEEITIAGGEEWQKPWRKPTKQREYTTKSVSATPKVQVRNYGELDIVGVRSKAPQYNPKE